MLRYIASHCVTLRHIASHCVTLRHIASHCVILRHIASHFASYCVTFCVMFASCFVTLTLQLVAPHSDSKAERIVMKLNFVSTGMAKEFRKCKNDLRAQGSLKRETNACRRSLVICICQWITPTLAHICLSKTTSENR